MRRERATTVIAFGSTQCRLHKYAESPFQCEVWTASEQNCSFSSRPELIPAGTETTMTRVEQSLFTAADVRLGALSIVAYFDVRTVQVIF